MLSAANWFWVKKLSAAIDGVFKEEKPLFMFVLKGLARPCGDVLLSSCHPPPVIVTSKFLPAFRMHDRQNFAELHVGIRGLADHLGIPSKDFRIPEED